VPEQAGTLELVARELALVLQPLEQRLASGNAETLLGELGIGLPTGFDAAASAIATTAVKAGELPPLVVKLTDAIEVEDASRILTEGIALIGQIRDLLAAIARLSPALNGAVAGAAGLTPAQRARIQAAVAQLPTRLLHLLLIDYLYAKSAGVAGVLKLGGVIEDRIVPGDTAADPTAPAFQLRELHLARLLELFSRPEQYLSTVIGLGAPGFDGMLVFPRIADLLTEHRLPWTLLTPPGQPPILEAYLLRLSTDPSTSPPSLTARLRTPAVEDFDRTYPLTDPWSLAISAHARFDAGLDARVTPPLNIALTPPSGALTIDASAGLQAAHPDPENHRLLLLGQSGGSRLELKTFSLAAGLQASASTGGGVTAEPTARAELDGGHMLIDLASGDGFISTVAGGVKLDSNFDLKAFWSASKGLQFEGSAALEIAIPTHVSLGPIDMSAIYLRTGLAPDGSLPTELSGSFKAMLGPIQASVDRIGLIVKTRFPAGGGNLGPIDLGFEFKAPNGIGLTVDAGVVKGGGYLFVDSEHGEYAGVLELDFSGIVSLKAIGLITTRMPDGSKGFSLLVVITAEFGTGIQLGFGFTLNAVGGVLGLNRHMALAPLVEGVRSNAISSVMFPRDVVANAPRIISDLRMFFPPQEGTFLIGPMAKLGWGTPTLVSLSLGVIIEIPGNIAIVGVLRIALPADEVAVIVLQVNFVGAIEFDRKRLYFFASIFDSHILFLTIEGEMAVLAAFGGDANFVLSVGGFHPAFKPPPLPVPTPKRIAVDILSSPTAKLRVEGYFAVTTNTAQFGARVDARFGFDDFGLEGSLAFDALLQFSPLHFIVTISASLSLKVFGAGVFSISLRLQLEGPAPWRAQGTGSISFLFFDIDVDFDITWGESRDTALPPISVMPLLKAEYDKPENWRALLPTGNNLLVSLRKLNPAVDTLVLHPVGVLRVSQRAVPLDLTITKVGNQKPTDAKRLTLAVTTIGLTKRGDVDESFAPGQFQDFDDAAKLSKPAFQPGHGGLDLSVEGEQLASGAIVKRVIRYELTTIDSAFLSHQHYQPFPFGLWLHFLLGAAVAKSALSLATQKTLKPFDEAVKVTGEKFVVASTATNEAVVSFASEMMATEHLHQQVAANPGLIGTLHVIPAFEAVA
jgi:hypothetical protein